MIQRHRLCSDNQVRDRHDADHRHFDVKKGQPPPAGCFVALAGVSVAGVREPYLPGRHGAPLARLVMYRIYRRRIAPSGWYPQSLGYRLHFVLIDHDRHLHSRSVFQASGCWGGSIPAGWLIIGVLFLALTLRFASVIFMKETPMITRSMAHVAKTHKRKNTNLDLVTDVKKLCSVFCETGWALIVGWLAGAAGPSPSAQLRQRHQ